MDPSPFDHGAILYLKCLSKRQTLQIVNLFGISLIVFVSKFSVVKQFAFSDAVVFIPNESCDVAYEHDPIPSASDQSATLFYSYRRAGTIAGDHNQMEKFSEPGL